jgi:hypothetical protein
MKAETQKQFKKEFLFTDNERATAYLAEAERAKEDLNLFILNAERVLRLKFTRDERQLLKVDGFNFIKERVKNMSPFPNSSEVFNLEAMGMTEVLDVYSYYNQNAPRWNNYKFELNDKNFFEITEAERQKIIESNSFYTQNEKQNHALRLAKELEKNFLEAEKEGYLNYYNRKVISKVTNLLKIDLDHDIKEYRIMVNHRGILSY